MKKIVLLGLLFFINTSHTADINKMTDCSDAITSVVCLCALYYFTYDDPTQNASQAPENPPLATPPKNSSGMQNPKKPKRD